MSSAEIILVADAPRPLSAAERSIRRAEQQARTGALYWRLSVWAGRLLLLAGILSAWQFAPETVIDPELTGRPTGIFRAWLGMASSAEFWSDVGVTFSEFAVGYLIGAVLGLACACLLTLDKWSYRITEPFIIAVYGIPMVSLGPLLLLWFGPGLSSKIALAAIATFPLVLLNTVVGIRAASQRAIDTLRVIGGSPGAIYFKLILPSAMPFTLTALKIAISAAVVAVVLGEFLGSSAGIGHIIQEQATYLAVDKMLAAIATLSLFVILLRGLLAPVESWVMRHHTTHGDMQQ